MSSSDAEVTPVFDEVVGSPDDIRFELIGSLLRTKQLDDSFKASEVSITLTQSGRVLKGYVKSIRLHREQQELSVRLENERTHVTVIIPYRSGLPVRAEVYDFEHPKGWD